MLLNQKSDLLGYVARYVTQAKTPGHIKQFYAIAVESGNILQFFSAVYSERTQIFPHNIYIDTLSLTAELSERQKAVDKLN